MKTAFALMTGVALLAACDTSSIDGPNEIPAAPGGHR